MFINNPNALQTLDILSARHQKTIKEFNKDVTSEIVSNAEATKVMGAVQALVTYNSFKQKYQPSAK